MLKRNKLSLILLLFVLLNSCKNEGGQGEVLAKVYEDKLYTSDLADIIPQQMKGDDSIRFVQTYINQWVKERLLVVQAERNLNMEMLDLEEQIQAYRNELVVFKYKEMLIQQKLDTIVSNDELQSYYEENKYQFTLRDNILQMAFIQLPKDDRNMRTVRKMMKAYEAEDKEQLREIGGRDAVNYFLEDHLWILFDDFVKGVPVETSNPADFLRKNEFFEITDSLHTYLVRINDYRVVGDVSPMNFEIDRIKSMIINRRKLDLIQQMEEGILKEAQSSGKAKIYVHS